MLKVMVMMAAVLAILPAQARAVDIANEGEAPISVVVVDGKKKTTFDIKEGAYVSEVCAACTVHVGNDKIDVEGGETVIIINGKIVRAD